MPAQYKTWIDQGENVGVQCSVCTRTHWTGYEQATDPQTGQPCSNCQAIKDGGSMKTENDTHKLELEQNANCTHGDYTQPKQPGVNYEDN
jgi:hypothetical protein